MNKLNYILGRISKNPKGLDNLNKKLNGLFLGNQMYIIEDEIYPIDFVFEKFVKEKDSWFADISINESNKVKNAIFNIALKKLMNKRIYNILMQMTDISNVMKSINRSSFMGIDSAKNIP